MEDRQASLGVCEDSESRSICFSRINVGWAHEHLSDQPSTPEPRGVSGTRGSMGTPPSESFLTRGLGSSELLWFVLLFLLSTWVREHKLGPHELSASTRRRVLEGVGGTGQSARPGVTGETHTVKFFPPERIHPPDCGVLGHDSGARRGTGRPKRSHTAKAGTGPVGRRPGSQAWGTCPVWNAPECSNVGSKAEQQQKLGQLSAQESK